MEKEFVPYEQALALKELGFDEPCFGYFYPTAYSIKTILIESSLDNNHTYYNEFPNKGDLAITYNYNEQFISAPLYQQAFRWFREKCNLHSEPYTVDMGAIEYSFQIRDLYSEKYVYDNFVGAGSSYSGTFNTYEEAELECLKKLIEIVKNK